MGIKFTVKTRIVINGKEYGSVEEMPPELRKAYEAVRAGAGDPFKPPPAGARITFNGTSYDSPEQMPPEVRKLYDLAVAASKAESPSLLAKVTADLPPGAVPRQPGVPRIVYWLVCAALLALFWLYLQSQGSKFS